MYTIFVNSRMVSRKEKYMSQENLDVKKAVILLSFLG